MKSLGLQKSQFLNSLVNWEKSESATYNQFHNILRLFDVLVNFLSPQVKRLAIVTYKHGPFELPHKCL